jgi:hypothetical protein
MYKQKMKTSNTPLRRQMTEMPVGTTIVVGREYKQNTVRNYATCLGIEQGKTFSTHYNRSNGTHEITRNA